MGERNYLTQMTSDLLERKRNKNVVDLIDVGTGEDYRRFHNYQEKSTAGIGGKDNGWRTVDLEALPRAAPIRDLFEVIDTATISSLPRQFWTLPKNRAHFETQVMMLLTQDQKLVIPRPKAPRAKSAQSVATERSAVWRAKGKTEDSDSIKLASFDADFDREARELYEWSQFL